MSITYKAMCKKCGRSMKKTAETIEEAKTRIFSHDPDDGTLPYKCNGKYRFYKLEPEQTPEPKPESHNPPSILKKEQKTISNLYNIEKLDKIENSTCKRCKHIPDKCSKSPEMLAICQVESLEYRLRSGKYNIGTGTGKFAEDINGVIIDGTPVYVEDIKRLFITRTDTFSLYEAEDSGKQVVRVPETNRPPTDEDILQSLSGKITIGFRPINPETNLCKWICYDVDKHSCEVTIYKANPRQAVDEIVKLLKKWYALTGYVELSGSPDSYHISVLR